MPDAETIPECSTLPGAQEIAREVWEQYGGRWVRAVRVLFGAVVVCEIDGGAA